MFVELKKRTKDETSRSHIEINFKILDNLVYHTVNDKNRLYIFKTLKEEVFRMIYDDNHYIDFHHY